METVTRDPWLDMTAVAHGYFHRQDFHLLDKQARLAALSLDSFRSGWMAATAALGQRTKSLRSSPLRGGKSREAGSQVRG